MEIISVITASPTKYAYTTTYKYIVQLHVNKYIFYKVRNIIYSQFFLHFPTFFLHRASALTCVVKNILHMYVILIAA